MSVLPANLRRLLEDAIKQAREIAEGGACKALEALAVHEPDPYRHMNDARRNLRRKLRAQAKQLGDGESQTRRGAYEIKHLVEKLAYDQWHRLLFARFLLENNLLISPEHGVSVSLDDCKELAPSLGLKDAWAVASRFAAKELPEIFRADDPAGSVELPVEDRNPLIQLVTGLPVDVLTASDSLGWCYQFWQAERWDEINAAGNKIGADELPAVTQVFTEHYMVDFLLDNTLGAWHAGKVLAAKPTLAEAAQSEEELRNAVALPGCPWEYLRFIKAEDDRWAPAAGTFDGWPKTARELKCLDPCMGSGHFLVAIFERIVALRIAEEKLDEAGSVAAVICDNLFGLEIDPRCTQIGAFNLALAAWRRVGHCKLPPMHIACSGLAPNAKKEDWLKLTGENERLQRGMARLYALFKDAPVLGSLIDPGALSGDLIEAEFHELQPLLGKALGQETKDDTVHEMAVTAHGVAKAAEILAGQFTLVATNVPYLGRGKQNDVLKKHLERNFLNSKADLATCFVERCLKFCAKDGATALVTPQNWLFLTSYAKLRESLLKQKTWNLVARLGPGAFETMGGHVINVGLLVLSAARPDEMTRTTGIDVSAVKQPSEKASYLRAHTVAAFQQRAQLGTPDYRIVLASRTVAPLLEEVASALAGINTGDYPRFGRVFTEIDRPDADWEYQQTTTEQTKLFAGASQLVKWCGGAGEFGAYVESLEGRLGGSWKRGAEVWGKSGITVSQMSSLPVSVYLGTAFDSNVSAVVPDDSRVVAPLWCYFSSPRFVEEVRSLDQKMNVTNATLAKVPFDLAHWQKVAAEKYPHGLPKPSSSDPTQWLFNGHPKGSDQPLHVAMARLLGYQWPRQTGSSFPDCPALGPDNLGKLPDEDGIVCLSAIVGKASAADRLRELLARAWGNDWNAAVLEDLLARVGYAGKTLDDWLRNGFFEQHCALFHHRPFIWHVWDAHKSGFSALVNYHQLTHANLEKLTYAYLGDWIRRQQAAVEAEEAGSDARLQAAKQLHSRLKLILEGEPPYDLFVRWKPLSNQAIGWHPDVNDGVRLNIRPFLAQDIPGGKKGAGILRVKPNIQWEKDRGKEPVRDKKDFPWFWSWDEEKQDFVGAGKEPDGNRWNNCHYTNELKKRARETSKTR
jgi:hypothetical protein